MGPGPDSGLPVDARPEAGVGDGAGVQEPLEAVRSMRDVQGKSETTMCLGIQIAMLFPCAAGINRTRGVDAFGAAVVVRHPGGVKAAWR